MYFHIWPYTHPSIMFSGHRGGGSEVSLHMLSSVCRCCCHGNNRWNCQSESWVDCRFTPCPEIRSWPPGRGGGLWILCVCEREAREMRFCPSHAPCCFFFFFTLTLTSVDSPLSPWQPYPRALHLKLESSCPWIILSWDRFLEYPGQNYPEGDIDRRNGAGSHFWGGLGVCKCLSWTVSISWQWHEP